MGAAGTALFCKNGHIYQWYEEHLYWDDNLYESLEKARASKCDCGEGLLCEISHYGSINDCICLENEIPEKGIIEIGKDRIKRRIPNAVDYNDIPIEAYEYVTLTKYRIPDDVISSKRYEVV